MNWDIYFVQEHELQALINHNHPITVNDPLTPNAGIELWTATGEKFNAIYDAKIGAIRKLDTSNPQFSKMANRDLALYNDHLRNPDITTIILDGIAGTGKTSTVCSHLVEGLMKAKDGKDGIPMAYISKPHVGVGQGYGYLPGSLHEKVSEEFKSYTQYFNRYGQPGLADYLMCVGVEEQGKFGKQRALEQPMLEILPFEYIRGRDIEKGWVVLDEAQNTNQKEMATFLTRTGDDAKVVVIGDTTPAQIDRKGNDSEHNGLAFVRDVYEGKKYAGYVEMNTIKHILRGQRVRDLFKYLKD